MHASLACAAAKAVAVRKYLGGNPMPVRVRPRADPGLGLQDRRYFWCFANRDLTCSNNGGRSLLTVHRDRAHDRVLGLLVLFECFELRQASDVPRGALYRIGDTRGISGYGRPVRRARHLRNNNAATARLYRDVGV